MWSWQLNRIKKLLKGSDNLAGYSDIFTKMQEQKQSSYFFTNIGNWQYLIELFVASCVLSLVLAISKSQSITEVVWFTVLQYILYINWIVIAFAVSIRCLKSILTQVSQIKGLVFGFLLLQVIVVITNIVLNAIHYFLRCHALKLDELNSHILFHHLGVNLSYGVLLGAFCLRYLYVRDQWFRQQKSELEARIQAIQARIQPHFLFNSLNSVVSLISIDPEKAEDMLINLSQLFRVSFQQLKLVKLAEEVKICQQYIAIEKIRLGDRLDVVWRLPHFSRLESIYIPLLTLQPLLENCIFHGVERMSGLCEVNIMIEILTSHVNIVITNPYQDSVSSMRQGHGLALENIKQRLKAHYGQHASLQSFTGDHIFTTVLSYQYLNNEV